MRCGIYARVSTSDKDQNPKTQLQPLREFVQAQGWSVVGEFVDQASATDLRNRKQWSLLLDLAAKRKIDCILVWKLDRFARSVAHASNTLQDLKRWGVGLRSYTEPFIDTSQSSPATDLMFNLLVSFSQFEKSIIAERVRAGMSRAKREGRTLGRPVRTLPENWPELRTQILSRQMSQREAARSLGLSLSSIQRFLARPA